MTNMICIKINRKGATGRYLLIKSEQIGIAMLVLLSGSILGTVSWFGGSLNVDLKRFSCSGRRVSLRQVNSVLRSWSIFERIRLRRLCCKKAKQLYKTKIGGGAGGSFRLRLWLAPASQHCNFFHLPTYLLVDWCFGSWSASAFSVTQFLLATKVTITFAGEKSKIGTYIGTYLPYISSARL